MIPALQRASTILEAARSGASLLSDEDMHALSGEFYRDCLAEWRKTPEDFENWRMYLNDIWDPEDGFASFAPIGIVRHFLSSRGVVLPVDQERKFSRTFGKAAHDAVRRYLQVESGDYRPDKRLEKFPDWKPVLKSPETRPEVTLSGEMARLRKAGAQKVRTLAETEYALKNFQTFLNHEDATRLERSDILAWRTALIASGVGNQTVNNRMSLIASVLKQAMNDGTVRGDLFERVRLSKKAGKKRLPYDNDDAGRILRAARDEGRPSIRWSHWVMAYTGMRSAEVLQLTVSDIREDNGIPFISVNEDTEDKSVKNGTTRHVPIHRALIAEGFLAYVAGLDKAEPLFPDKKADAHGNRGGRSYNVIGRWVRDTVGITDTQKAPSHSWRHRMEDELRAASVPEDARDAILGHARKTTGRLYGVRGESLKRLQEAINRVPDVSV